jgi:hypothetical protein
MMNDNSLEKNAAVFNLYKYFIWSDHMKNDYDNLLQKIIQEMIPPARFDIEYNLYMSYWFSSLYVVIEGWTQLRLKDKEIGVLLNSPNVQLLRRYRNGVFHFQKDYFDERFLVFLRDGINRIEWIKKLHDEFKRFFHDWYEVEVHRTIL